MSRLRSYSEELERQWIQRLSKGDERALEEIIRTYCSDLARSIHGYVRSAEAIEEILQDSFLDLWRCRTHLRTGSSLRGYLYVIAKNKAINLWRRENKKPLSLNTGLDPESSDSPEREFEAIELAELLQHGIDALPDKCRTVFRLHRDSGLTYLQISRILKISPRTVEAQISRALKTLRNRLSAYL